MTNNNQQQNMATKNGQPPLRFRGFDGAWEEKKLGEVCNFWNGKAHEQDISETGYIVVNSKFISSNGDVKKFSNRQISPLSKGDICIVMSDVPNGKALAKCFLVDKDDTYTLNQRIGGIKSEKIISDFLYRVLDRKKYFLKFDNKVTQTNLRKDEILKCPLKFPPLPEQEKIAGFLSAVDEWLENLKEQKRSYERYKKGLMQKLFPAKDQSAPSIRFNGFSGDWEEKKLGEIAEITTGKLDANAMTENGKYRFYTCAKEFYKIDKFTFDTEALLVSGNGANVGYIHYYNGKFNAYQRTYVLDKFAENILYIKFFLDKELKFRIEREKKAGNTPYIVMSTLADMKIKLPSLAEQEKIATLLSSIDDIIEKTETKITQAEQWKKGLMQRLFV
jgi:type I restriction enzyme S subunit